MLLTDTLDDITELIREADMGLEVVYEGRMAINRIMGFYDLGRSSRLLDFLRFCTGESVNSTGYLSTPTEDFPWLNFTSVDECHDKYWALSHHIQSDILDVYGSFRHSSIKFVEAANEVSLRSEYPECYTRIDDGKLIKDEFNEEFELVYSLRQVPNTAQFEAALSTVEQLHGHYSAFQMPLSEYQDIEDQLSDLCNWTEEFAEKYEEKGFHFLSNIERTHDAARRSEPLLRRWAEHVFAIAKGNSYPIADIMAEYLNESITKQELAQEFLSPPSVAQREEFLGNITEMKQLIQVQSRQLKIEGRFDVLTFLTKYCNILKNGKEFKIGNHCPIFRKIIELSAANILKSTQIFKNG